MPSATRNDTAHATHASAIMNHVTNTTKRPSFNISRAFAQHPDLGNPRGRHLHVLQVRPIHTRWSVLRQCHCRLARRPRVRGRNQVLFRDRIWREPAAASASPSAHHTV